MCLILRANVIELRLQSRQTSRISTSIVRSLSLCDLISVSAENQNSQHHEDANGRIVLIAFKLIAGYNLLIEI